MRRWWSKIKRRWLILPGFQHPGDIWLLIRIFSFAALVPILMLLPMPKLERLLGPKRTPPPADPARVAQIIDYTDVVLRIGRPLVRSRCLTRGLTLYYFLRRAGLAVSLCFGVENFDNEFRGHCWLVKDGLPFSEAGDPLKLYTPVFSLPNNHHVR